MKHLSSTGEEAQMSALISLNPGYVVVMRPQDDAIDQSD